jgi:hypothetical protein
MNASTTQSSPLLQVGSLTVVGRTFPPIKISAGDWRVLRLPNDRPMRDALLELLTGARAHPEVFVACCVAFADVGGVWPRTVVGRALQTFGLWTPERYVRENTHVTRDVARSALEQAGIKPRPIGKQSSAQRLLISLCAAFLRSRLIIFDGRSVGAPTLAAEIRPYVETVRAGHGVLEFGW